MTVTQSRVSAGVVLVSVDGTVTDVLRGITAIPKQAACVVTVTGQVQIMVPSVIQETDAVCVCPMSWDSDVTSARLVIMGWTTVVAVLSAIVIVWESLRTSVTRVADNVPADQGLGVAPVISVSQDILDFQPMAAHGVSPALSQVISVTRTQVLVSVHRTLSARDASDVRMEPTSMTT